jgi:hypothetical protein
MKQGSIGSDRLKIEKLIERKLPIQILLSQYSNIYKQSDNKLNIYEKFLNFPS